jgi:sulfate adenylyltransferase subunit 1 (EFTu-like GTPase family)
MSKYYLELIQKKRNLILAISKSEVINYEITEQNTISDLFLKFLKDLKIQIEKKI